MKKICFSLLTLFAICLEIVYCQDHTALYYIEKSNNYYDSVQSGKINIRKVKFKGAFSEDTTFYYNGDLYIWRDTFDINNNCRFLLLHDNKIIAASDLEYYYYNLNKSLKKDLIQNDNSEKELRSNSQRSNLLPKFIIKKQNGIIDSSLMEKAVFVYPLEGSNNTILIEVQDSFPNDIGDKSGRKYVNLDIRIYLNSTTFAITKVQEWVHIFEQPQYREIEISEVIPISTRETDNCDSIFNTISILNTAKPEDIQQSSKRLSGVQRGERIKDFHLAAIKSNNTSVSLSDFTEGLLIIDFWYKSCYPCLLAMPTLEEIHRKHLKDKVFVLGINPYDKNKENLLSFLSKRDITYPTLLDESGRITKDLNITAFPTILIVEAKTKKVVEVFVGFSDELESRIQEIIQENLK